MGRMRGRIAQVRRWVRTQRWAGFFLHIVLPVLLAGLLFALAIFQILIPSMERQLLDRKREMIQELTRTASSILQEYADLEATGSMSRAEAQRAAVASIELLRYGDDGKDYFWITDMHPTMVVHPYRPDLNGQDLSTIEDLRGKHMFVAFVEAVRAADAGYVDYYWQWKDDPRRVVPKLSYVQAFRPWQWVIGTGIYVEDVREEIARTKRDLVNISLAITAVVAALLFYIARRSLHIERQRAQAEAGLRDSNAKYSVLLEATTEGTLMILDGYCAYSNKTLQEMLGYTPGELAALDLQALLAPADPTNQTTWQVLQSSLHAGQLPSQLEASLRCKDGALIDVLLTVTRIVFAGQQGYIVIARDISRHLDMQLALDQTRRQFRTMTNAISLGVFRSAWGRKATLIEHNPAVQRIFGLAADADMAQFDWLERIADPAARSAFVERLTRAEILENYRLELQRADGRHAEVLLFALLVKDEAGQPLYCDGIIEDVTEQRRYESEREALIAQLQTSLFFLQEPIAEAIRPALTCDMNRSIAEAAALMTRQGASAILATGPGGEPLGIATDYDFRSRVVGEGCDPQRPLREIMSAPLATISAHALVYEAILRMQERRVGHLVVKDEIGGLQGLVHRHELIHYRQYSAIILTNSIRRAASLDEIVEAHARLPGLVKALVDSGARVRAISRIITSIADAVVERLLGLAIEQLGPPPTRFAFLALGSQGREEQTLLTDQDNAILYDDPEPGAEAAVAAYFLALGKQVCDWLDAAGYFCCPGDLMASNPRWNQPLSAWQAQFSDWIHNADPQELLELNMLFDFRCVAGEPALAGELRARVFTEIAAYPPFLLQFAQNALLYRPPLGLRGQIVTTSAGDGPRTLSLKEALLPVVNYARLYALKHQIEDTHTLDRLARLHERGLLSREIFDELRPDYEALLRLRIDRQALAIQERRRPTNLISPQEWTPSEEAMLKRLFSTSANLRKKISYDFLGMV